MLSNNIFKKTIIVMDKMPYLKWKNLGTKEKN